jgi:PKD repeat protein
MKDRLDPKFSAGMLAGLVCITLLVVSSYFLDSIQEQHEEQLASVHAALVKAKEPPKPFTGDFPAFKFEGPSQREEALRRLGDRLPEVAAWYGMSPTDLQGLMRRDKNLWIDDTARLFYIDDAGPEGGAGVAPEAVEASLGALYPLEDTFKLHSRPGSKKIIYLDFDGMLLTGTAFNSWKGITSITAPAWDLDGNQSSFGAAEREQIQRIWQRVSEDFAPFDIDITTEAPPQDRLAKTTTGDEYYGTTVLISPISQYFGAYGGLGYVGVLGNLYYQPALVFPEQLGNNNRYVAEAISHEAGHNLGLNHDGTTGGQEYYWGHGSWAPIMGGAYYAAVSQFSRGEYSGANNTQDDLAVITQQGVALLVDDCGATNSGACALTQGGGTVTGRGVIERRGDVDFHRLQADAGPVSIEVGMHPFGSNLNAEAALLDDRGTVLATAPRSTSKITLTASVPGGTYYVRVQGVGSSDYSDYASLGNYQIQGTVTYSGKLPPVAAASASPLSGSAPLAVQFSSDGSADPDGTITAYSWQFGDGTTATESDPSKTYTSTGTFTAVLTVTDNDGVTASDSVVVTVSNTAPSAVVSATPQSGNFPLTVAFDGGRSSDPDGTITAYSWQFGDGATGQGATISHTYAARGTYTAKLTVTDNGGKTATAQVTISVTDGSTVTAPSNVTATSPNRGTVALAWSDNANNETEYRVYRWLEQRRQSPNYTLMATLPANSVSYTNSPVSSGTYLYYVEAVNITTGNRAASSPVKFRVR